MLRLCRSGFIERCRRIGKPPAPPWQSPASNKRKLSSLGCASCSSHRASIYNDTYIRKFSTTLNPSTEGTGQDNGGIDSSSEVPDSISRLALNKSTRTSKLLRSRVVSKPSSVPNDTRKDGASEKISNILDRKQISPDRKKKGTTRIRVRKSIGKAATINTSNDSVSIRVSLPATDAAPAVNVDTDISPAVVTTGDSEVKWSDDSWRGGARAIFTHLRHSGTFTERARSEHISKDLWNRGCNSIMDKTMYRPESVFAAGTAENNELYEIAMESTALHRGIVPKSDPDGARNLVLRRRAHMSRLLKFLDDTLYRRVRNWCVELDGGRHIEECRQLSTSCDLRAPHLWYPMARLMKRRIIYHGGPTNSGKTFNAIQRLKMADKDLGGGVFLGPLRLLALEIYQKLNSQGIYTSLSTGQEKRLVPFATHIACTIEMADINADYDVAVIDEIQMIGDPERGAGWTRAFLGLRARELHVCGGMEGVDLVKKLCELTGDSFELHEYGRKLPLIVAEESLNSDYSKVQKGDCIVAFSKADIFKIRHRIESLTPLKCCVVYGQLPPEVRAEQARNFNDSTKGYDVLVASDAIGMGLNLNIRRIIFHSVEKTSSQAQGGSKHIERTLLKQIAGRAGRMGSFWEQGEVTAYNEKDMDYIRETMDTPLEPVRAAGLFPSVEHVVDFHKKLATVESSRPGSSETPPPNLVKAMDTFVHMSLIDPLYFKADYSQLRVLMEKVCTVGGLSLEDCYVLSQAPVNIRDEQTLQALYTYASAYAALRIYSPNVRLPSRDRKPKTLIELNEVCTRHQVLDLYLWLGLRFDNTFRDIELAQEQRKYSLSLIESGIKTVAAVTAKTRSRKDSSANKHVHAQQPAKVLSRRRHAQLLHANAAKGSEISPKGYENSPKGSENSPKGSENYPKGSENSLKRRERPPSRVDPSVMRLRTLVPEEGGEFSRKNPGKNTSAKEESEETPKAFKVRRKKRNMQSGVSAD